MTKYSENTHRIIDTVLLTLCALFFWAMPTFFGANEPAPNANVFCMFLSVGCFGIAGYRATH